MSCCKAIPQLLLLGHCLCDFARTSVQRAISEVYKLLRTGGVPTSLTLLFWQGLTIHSVFAGRSVRMYYSSLPSCTLSLFLTSLWFLSTFSGIFTYLLTQESKPGSISSAWTRCKLQSSKSLRYLLSQSFSLGLYVLILRIYETSIILLLAMKGGKKNKNNNNRRF